MLLYVINVDACIHTENYQIFFYEPAAGKKLELYGASWNPESLTGAFREIADRINRRGLQFGDYQVVVCVRRQESERLRETTLYAKAMVHLALEQSGMLPVITASGTRKVTVLFQVEQPYYGTVPRTAAWEEEQSGLDSLLDRLGLNQQEERERQTADEWEARLREAVSAGLSGKDPVTMQLGRKLSETLEAERVCRETEESDPDEQPVMENDPEESPDEEEKETKETFTVREANGYLSHRVRSLLDGSGMNRDLEVIYWPVAGRQGRAGMVGMLSLIELLRTGGEITPARAARWSGGLTPKEERNLLSSYRHTVDGYRYQLQELCARLEQEELPGAEQERQPYHAPSMPELPAEMEEHIERIRQQLESCRISLHRSRRKEAAVRVGEIAQTLAQSLDGLEDELRQYQNQVLAYLYRELEGDGTAPQTRQIIWKQVPQTDGIADEQGAKEAVAAWDQKMKRLTDCTALIGPWTSLGYLAGMTAAAAVPWICWQGEMLTDKSRVLPALAAAAAVAGGTLLLQVRIPGHFIRMIGKNYDELERRLLQLLDRYQERAEWIRETAAEWIIGEKARQEQKTLLEETRGRSRLAAQKAGCLTAIRKLQAGLDVFSALGDKETKENSFGTELCPEENPEIQRRIHMPFDFERGEAGNEGCWPVMYREGGEQE